jgi:hypothetical protein
MLKNDSQVKLIGTLFSRLALSWFTPLLEKHLPLLNSNNPNAIMWIALSFQI